MADPYWLLSAAAQSAAALVAIVGGLIASRLIGLASEREGLRRRLELLRNDAKLQTRRANDLSALLGDHDWGASVSVSLIHREPSPEELAEGQRLRNERYKDMEDAKARARAARHESEIVEEALGRVQQPEGLLPGLCVLAGFALVGVVFPLVLMGTLWKEVHLAWRVAVIAGFTLGLVAVLGYIAWFARGLRDDPST